MKSTHRVKDIIKHSANTLRTSYKQPTKAPRRPRQGQHGFTHVMLNKLTTSRYLPNDQRRILSSTCKVCGKRRKREDVDLSDVSRRYVYQAGVRRNGHDAPGSNSLFGARNELETGARGHVLITKLYIQLRNTSSFVPLTPSISSHPSLYHTL